MCGHEQRVNLLFQTEPVSVDPTSHTVSLPHPRRTSKSPFLNEFRQLHLLNAFS
jgi:hypothetical protein